MTLGQTAGISVVDGLYVLPLTPDPQFSPSYWDLWGKSVHRRAMEAWGQALAFCSMRQWPGMSLLHVCSHFSL